MRVTLDALKKGLGLSLGRREEDMEVGELGARQDPYQRAPDNGIVVEPTPISGGDRVKVRYNGLLVQDGAQQVFLHYGFGPGEWEDVNDVMMHKNDAGEWEVKVEAPANRDRFEFCFRDNAYNWDNNDGVNWSYEIHNGR